MSADPARPGELREDDHYTTALYRAAIGTVNTTYYLPLFDQWELEHRLKTRWNWAAGMATLDWLIFRKMGGYALAYTGALTASALFLVGLGHLWLGFSNPVFLSLTAGLLLLSVAVPGLLGNRWFHTACNKAMTRALQSHTDVAQACQALSLQASTRKRALVIAALHAVVLLVAGLVVAQFIVFTQQALVGRPSEAKPAPSPQSASGRVTQTTPALAPAPTAIPIPAPTASMALPPPPPPQATVPVPTTTSGAMTPAAVTKPRGGAFMINVGLFAVAGNAQITREKLEAEKLPVSVETLDMPRGARTRVRCGPFATKEQAEAAIIKIRALGLDAVLSEP